MRRFTLIALLLASPVIADGYTTAPGVAIRDSLDVDLGRVNAVKCVGVGITCVVTGGMLTVTVIPGGGGAGNFVAVSVDFGSGATVARTVVTGQAWVTATSVILCAPTLIQTDANLRTEGAEDAVIEGLTGAISTRVVGTGFTLSVSPKVGTAAHQFIFHCTGA
jgi:hypothetical protein